VDIQKKVKPSPNKPFKATRGKGLSSKQKKALKLLDELKGSGRGVWNEDAQKYVNRLRSDRA